MTDYKKFLRPYDIIVVYNPRSFLHRLIFKTTGYKAGHVALYLGRDEIVQATSTGVKKRFTNNYGGKLVHILRNKNGLIPEQGQMIDCYVKESINKEYAFLQLVLLWVKYTFRLSHIPDVSKKAMICSEFVANCYINANIDLCAKKKSHEVVPSDIFNSPKLDHIFSGIIE